MPSKSFILSLFLLCAFAWQNKAQISPGKLYSGHSHLEGISNCFKCHEIGSTVSDQKCLECHQEIKKRVSAGKGYHASNEVKKKNCAECHSDHHGPNFRIINFDEKAFDHKLTGYALEGAHAKPDCRDCHQSDHIRNQELRKRESTFLGLGTDCLICHEDVHQGTLDNDCMKCHIMDHFSPAASFSHDRTPFPLRGRHIEIDCRNCHQETNRNGKVFVEYSNIPHSSCKNCHDDVHQGRLGNRCTDCHSEQSFSLLIGRFDHSVTEFPLEGKHRQLKCMDCHKTEVAKAELFQDYVGAELNKCTTCHEDVHQNKFGQVCTDCHTVQSFRLKQDPDAFEHDLTGFPLLGKHENVDCKLCHKGHMTEPVAHEQCADCHEDFHKGAFSKDQIIRDCRQCHREDGFSPSTYSLDDHRQSDFPLLGAHEATPCIFCHNPDGKEWIFTNLGNRCNDCHQDIHAGYLDPKYYPESDCRICHTSQNWHESLFDHNITSFELIGKHRETDCRNCHVADNEINPGAASPVFHVSSDCVSCHADQHRGQFSHDGPFTDCARCHESFGWEASLFNHDEARFKLDGVHAALDCEKCHFSLQDELGSYVNYKLEKLACSDCH